MVKGSKARPSADSFAVNAPSEPAPLNRAPSEQSKALFKRYLDLKKVTQTGNAHGLCVLVYDLMQETAPDGSWLFDKDSVKAILNLFGANADWLVDKADEERNTATEFAF